MQFVLLQVCEMVHSYRPKSFAYKKIRNRDIVMFVLLWVPSEYREILALTLV